MMMCGASVQQVKSSSDRSRARDAVESEIEWRWKTGVVIQCTMLWFKVHTPAHFIQSHAEFERGHPLTHFVIGSREGGRLFDISLSPLQGSDVCQPLHHQFQLRPSKFRALTMQTVGLVELKIIFTVVSLGSFYCSLVTRQRRKQDSDV